MTFAAPGSYCACYSWSDPSAPAVWATVPEPLTIAQATPSAYRLVASGDLGVREAIVLSFVDNRTDLFPGQDEGKLVLISQP